MGGSFSSSKQSKTRPKGTISDIDRAVLDLKNSRDRLSRYKTKLNNDSAKLLERAKKSNSEGDKKTAVGLLKLRKYKLKEAENVDSQLLTLMQMISNIQSKEEEKEVLSALRSGKDALQKLHEETSVDDVLKLMDEVHEQNEVEREINDILSHGESLSSVEEAEIEAEFAALEAEMLETKEEEEVKVDLPTVPDKKLPDIVEKVEAAKEPGRIAVAS